MLSAGSTWKQKKQKNIVTFHPVKKLDILLSRFVGLEAFVEHYFKTSSYVCQVADSVQEEIRNKKADYEDGTKFGDEILRHRQRNWQGSKRCLQGSKNMLHIICNNFQENCCEGYPRK